MFTTLLILAIGYAAVRNLLEVKVRLKPQGIANTVAEAKSLTHGLIDEVRLHLMSKARRDEELIKRRAQMMYDAAVGGIFAHATPEEQQTLLDLFAKYGQPQS
jgi:hypothetical protein